MSVQTVTRKITIVGPLRAALYLDAAVTAVNGVAYIALAPVLDGVLGASAGLLVGLGVFLLAYAVVVWRIGAGSPVSRRLAQLIVEGNVLWAVGSVLVAAFDPFTLTTLGTAWTMLQALTVAGFAALQYAALRRR